MTTAGSRDTARRLERVRPRWWTELGLVLGFYYVYSLIRSQAQADGAIALQHALDLIEVERWLGLYHEQTLQSWALTSEPLMVVVNLLYSAPHFIVTPLALILVYRRRPSVYRFWRNVLAITTASALIGYHFWPLMPPRLLPEAYGFVDTLAQYPTIWSFDSSVAVVANQYAAMPSLHFGWASFVGLVAWSTLPRPWGLVAGVGYPAMTLTTIVLTGNHFFLDAVGGLVVLAVGLGGARLVDRVAGRDRGWLAVQRQAPDLAGPGD